MAHTEFDEASSSEAGRTAELLANYLERLERGETPQLDELIAAYPHASRELLEDLQKLGALHLAALTAGDDLLAGHFADQSLSAHAPLLGDFRLIRPLGQGGMGVVYEAEQLSLARRVALKTLRASAALDPKQIARFRREAYAAASLDHPGIASVYAVGSDRGVHYYAMQYVDGQSLAGVIRQLRDAEPTSSRTSPTPSACPATSSLAALRANGRRAYFRRVAELGAEAARALHHAHAMGVVHRDVKPSNLLLDRDGAIYVADFGLAQTRADAELTQTGELVGTLRYMSPEQAAGRRANVDRRTDVYSLGASLYELATLRPAFAGDDRARLLLQIAAENPPRPSVWDRSTPHDLETILAKAMAKDPADRYETAAELGEDLQRFARGESILARPLTRRAQTWNWCRRHRAAAASLAAVVVLLTTLAAGGAWVAARQTRLARQAQDELAARTINQLYHDWFSGNVGRVREQLALHAAASSDHEETFEWALLRNLVQRSDDNVLFRTDDPNWPKFVKFSPDGRWLACGQPEDGTALYDFHERKWIVLDNDPLGGAAGVEFTPDGKHLVTVSWRSVVNIREVPSGRIVGPIIACAPEFSVDTHGWSNPFQLSPDGCIAATGLNTGAVALVDLKAGTCRRINAHSGNITTLAFFRDGTRLLTCASDGTVRVWSMDGREIPIAPPRQPGGGVADVVIDPSTTELFVSHSQGVRRWDPETFAESLALQVESTNVSRLALSQSAQLATGDPDGRVTLWNIATGAKLETLRGHEAAVRELAFSPDGKRLATAGRDGTLRIWSIRAESRTTAHPESYEQRWSTELEFSSDGRTITYCTRPYGQVSGKSSRTQLRRYDLATNSVETVLETASEAYCSLALSPDGRTVLCGGSAGLALRSLNGDEVQILDDNSAHAYRHVKFSPDGRWLAGAGFFLGDQPGPTGFDFGVQTKTCFVMLCRREPDSCYLFRLQTTANTDRWRINAIGFSPDGRRLFASGGDGQRLCRLDEFTVDDLTARHLDVEEIPPGQQIDEVQDLAFAHCANLAGMVVQAGYYRTWLLDEGFRTPLRRQRSRLHSIALAPDGRLVALGSNDAIQLCDVRTGHPLATIPVGEVVCDMQFSPDGKSIAWASRGGRIELLRTSAEATNGPFGVGTCTSQLLRSRNSGPHMH